MVFNVIYGLVGLVSGLHSACWGAYKDSLYEEFKIHKFFRSLTVGLVLGILLLIFLHRLGVLNPNFGLFFVFVMAFERLFTESLKAFVREEDQKKYKIPSKLHFFGHVINNKFLRILVGLVFISLAIFFFYIPSIFSIDFGSNFLNALFWGAIAGLVGSAAGGAWKDAPMEGFKLLKFLRSPMVGGIWGIIFSFFTTNYSFLLFSCIGAERMSVEFYKTFITKTVPGKFKANKPVYRDWTKKRKVFIIPYILTWLIFALLLFI